jgi:hypothetical protein
MLLDMNEKFTMGNGNHLFCGKVSFLAAPVNLRCRPRYEADLSVSNTTGVTSGAGTAILPEHLSSPSVFSGIRVTRSLVLYACFVDRCLSVLLRYTDYDYLFIVCPNFSWLE